MKIWSATVLNAAYSLNDHIVLNNHFNGFETMLLNMNDITIHHRNIQTIMIQLFKIKYGLAPPILDSLLNRKAIHYNFRNLQQFQSERKRTLFYGSETISYRAPQLWTILKEEFKQRNAISFFEIDLRQWICSECPCRLCKVFVPNLEFIWGITPKLGVVPQINNS